MEHDYLSTSCLHGRHDHCLSTTGPDGPKTPGQCKWCPAMCRCDCHGDGPPPNSTRLMVDLLRAHRAKEPDPADYPEGDGHAQAVYWARYDEWQAVGFGLRMMVGARLIGQALDHRDG